MSDQAAFAAIILAGSRRGTDPVALAAGVTKKCLATVGGVPMVARVIEVLARHDAIGKMALVVDDGAEIATLEPLAELRRQGRLLTVTPAASLSSSVRAALDVLGRRPVLVTTADHALLDDAILGHFLDHARATNVDLAVGMVPSGAILAAYPESVRTFWRFRDERYSGANLFVLLTPAADVAVGFWRRVEQERKRPWRIARIFGWRHLLAYLLGRVTLDQAMLRASTVIGCRIRAVPIPIAEAAIDVDKPADLELAERIVRQRSRR